MDGQDDRDVTERTVRFEGYFSDALIFVSED